MIKLFLRLILGFCVVSVLLIVAITWTFAPELPPGVVKKTASVVCGNDKIDVEFYYKKQTVPQPMVVVAHGFSRSKRYMAGLGSDLASDGMIAAVLTQPSWFNHSRNAAAIVELARIGREGRCPIDAKGNGKLGLVGFSMGGLTSLLAAASLSPALDAWVGLDPVDFGGLGAAKAARVTAPGLVLLAATPPFNFHGSARRLVRDYAGPLQIMTIKDSTHCDMESPTDLLGQLACGWVKPGPQACFRATIRKFLHDAFAGNSSSGFTLSEDLELVRTHSVVWR